MSVHLFYYCIFIENGEKNSSAFYISETSYEPLLSLVQANYPQP